jgi:hypothetical protein
LCIHRFRDFSIAQPCAAIRWNDRQSSKTSNPLSWKADGGHVPAATLRVYDYGLFYVDLRNNVLDRVRAEDPRTIQALSDSG